MFCSCRLVLACFAEKFGERGKASRDGGVGGHQEPVYTNRAQSLFADGADGDKNGLQAEVAEAFGPKNFMKMMHGGRAEEENCVGALPAKVFLAFGPVQLLPPVPVPPSVHTEVPQ